MKALEKKVAALLLSRGVLAEEDLERALARYDGAVPLPDLLAEMGLAGAVDLARAQAEADGMDFVSFDEVVASEDALALLSPADAWKLRAIPLEYDHSGALRVAFADPSNVFIGDEIRLRAGRPVRLLLCEPRELLAALERYYGPAPERRGSSSSGMVLLPPASGSADSVHRLHQQRVRALRRSSGEVPGISRMETEPFEESREETLAEVERARASRGAYEEPTPAGGQFQAPNGDQHAAPAILSRAIGALVAAGSEEIAFEPGPVTATLRLRGPRGWRKVETYPTLAHPPLLERLREAAGLAEQPDGISLDHQFLLPTLKGDFLATLYLEPAAHGERALLRVAESRPLLPDPLRALPIPRAVADCLGRRLSGRAGGLFLLTAPHQRDLAWFRCSLLAWLVRDGNRDALCLERPHERRLAGVTSIHCPTREVLLASLANASFMNPDILVVCPVENGTILNRLFHVAQGGTTVIAGMTAPDVALAQGCLRAARVEPINLLRGLAVHLHLTKVPCLCRSCSAPLPEEEPLPEWARPEGREGLRRAAGCDACEGTGQGDDLLLADLHAPSPDGEPGTLEEIASADKQLQTLARSGLVDARAEL